MAGLSQYAGRALLEWITGKTAMPSLANGYIALFTAAPADDGTGGTEVSGGSYARVSTSGTDWNAATGSSPATITNAVDIVFPTASAAWGTIVAVGIYDASSGGNLKMWDYLGTGDWKPFTCSSASPGVLSSPAHGFSNGDLVQVTAEFGGTLPATGGSWAGNKTVASVSTDTFTAGVNTTGTGNGLVRKVNTQSVVIGASFKLSAGQVTLAAA